MQPAKAGEKLQHTDQAVGINHIALWARSRAVVDRFYREFLIPRRVSVTDPPEEYPVYTPGYYAVFFDHPINGIHWELARLPSIPSPRGLWKCYRALRKIDSDTVAAMRLDRGVDGSQRRFGGRALGHVGSLPADPGHATPKQKGQGSPTLNSSTTFDG